MKIKTHVEAVFEYPCDAIPVVMNQIIESPNPRLVTLPLGATGFEIVLVHTLDGSDVDGNQRTFVQRECIGKEYIVGYVYGRDDLVALEPQVAEGIAAFLDETDWRAVVMTPGGLFFPTDEDVEVIEPSQLKQKSVEGMPLFD